MGALTSKPYAFSARPWELADHLTFDYFDTFHSPVKLNTRGTDLLRVLPELRYSSANEWISDRVRFSYDSVCSPSRSSGFAFRFREVKFSLPLASVPLPSFFIPRFSCFDACIFSDVVLGSQRKLFSDEVLRLGRPTSAPIFDLPAPVTLIPSAKFQEAPAFFSVGLSVRYTHPALYAYLKRFRSLSRLFFDWGESSSISDYSVGSGLSSLLELVRFKLKVGVFFKNAYFFTSPNLFLRLSDFFSTKNVVPLFETPMFAGDVPRPYFAHERPLSVALGPYSHLDAVNFQISLPHPYESHGSYETPFSFKSLDQHEPMRTSVDVWGLMPSVSSSFELASLASTASTNLYVSPFYFSSAVTSFSYHDHVFGNSGSRLSLNLMLSFRRNEDYRHSHFCAV